MRLLGSDLAMYSIILTELGISVFEDDSCKKSFAFSDPAKEYLSIKNKSYNSNELFEFLSSLQRGVNVSDESLHVILKKESIDSQLMSSEEISHIQSSKPDILVDSGFAKDSTDAMEKLREFAMQLSSTKITELSQSPDLHVIQSINSLDEIDKITNAISSRLREWYGLHFPELDNIIDSINGYAQIVLAGKREKLSKKVFEDAGFPDTKVEMLTLLTEKSRGGDISEENLQIVQSLAKQILDMFELRKNLESHVETQMEEIAPNTSAILGHAVGARILARAGSMKRLSSMPASTIQVLGAEKALFRALKTGSRPPKHGLLFQHATVHAAPRWQRGKLARAIAGKAAIAARVDVYGGGLNETLLEKLNVRVNEISEKYKEPVERQPEEYQNERPESKRQFKSNFRDSKKQFRKSKFKSQKSKTKKRKRFGRR